MRERVFVGIPVRQYDYTDVLDTLIDWCQASETHTVRHKLGTGYGCDKARSDLIRKAREWKATVHVQVDSDILPEFSLDQAVAWATEDFEQGYGLVISNTLSRTGKIMVKRPDNSGFGRPENVPVDGLYEIGRGPMGFGAMNWRVLDELKAAAMRHDIDGDPYPMYCIGTPEEGEDYHLCRNVRESTRMKVGCDPRFNTQHIKTNPIPSWRKEYLTS